MASCIKAVGEVPVGQIAFFRSFFAIFPILVFLAANGELGTAFHTRRPLSHLARGLVGICAMGLGFFALTRLPLPEAITLSYAQPLLVVVFSAIFLREVIRFYRWSAVIVGLVGVVVISWPKLSLFAGAAPLANQELLGVAAALGSAAISASAMLLIRSLVHTERTGTIVLWFSLTGSVVALFTIPFGWQALHGWQVAFLVSAGVAGGVAQVLMTEAYRHAEASTVAPFEYTSMIVGLVVGYLAFGDRPTIHILVGGAIVIGAGIFIVWREQRLGLERKAAEEASPPP